MGAACCYLGDFPEKGVSSKQLHAAGVGRGGVRVGPEHDALLIAADFLFFPWV